MIELKKLPHEIDHAHVARCARSIIDLDAKHSSQEDSIHMLAPLVSRAYLARSDEMEKVVAENARLREALEPFAKAAHEYDVDCDPDDTILNEEQDRQLTIGDLRKAQAAFDACGGAA